MQPRISRLAQRLCCILTIASSAASAGPLDPPPGPVVPTHKTLTDVEPRTAINAANTPGDADSLFRIAQAGSYFLPSNVMGVVGKNGIEVSVPVGGKVSIDFRGHTLQGVAGSLGGVYADGGTPHLFGGTIRGWPGDAVWALAPVTLTDMIIESDSPSGCLNLAHSTTIASRVRDCMLRTTEGPAIIATGTLEVSGSTLIGDGCNTTSFTSYGPMGLVDTTVRISNSTFSSPVISLADGSTLLRDVTIAAETVNAPSLINFFDIDPFVLALKASATSCTFTGAVVSLANGNTMLQDIDVNVRGCSATSLIADTGNHRLRAGKLVAENCTFTAPVVMLANGNTLSDLTILLSNATAPAAIQVGSNNSIADLAMLLQGPAGAPLAVELAGDNNVVDLADLTILLNGATGVRSLANGNTLRNSRVSGSGAGPITAMHIGGGANNNLVVNNEFVRLGGGVAVNNQGGVSNAIAPVITNAALGTATNPFANIQH